MWSLCCARRDLSYSTMVRGKKGGEGGLFLHCTGKRQIRCQKSFIRICWQSKFSHINWLVVDKFIWIKTLFNISLESAVNNNNNLWHYNLVLCEGKTNNPPKIEIYLQTSLSTLMGTREREMENKVYWGMYWKSCKFQLAWIVEYFHVVINQWARKIRGKK